MVWLVAKVPFAVGKGYYGYGFFCMVLISLHISGSFNDSIISASLTYETFTQSITYCDITVTCL